MDLAERLTAFKHEHPYREITVGYTAWRYRTGGVLAAPAVLLLPGGTLVPDPFFIVLDALGQRYRVIAPAYPAAQMMAELVTGLNGILDVEHIAAVNVVGSCRWLQDHLSRPRRRVQASASHHWRGAGSG